MTTTSEVPTANTAASADKPSTPASPTVTLAKALNTALADAMAADERVVVFGEDVGALGGVFRVTDGLTARFGERRCFDTPLAEASILGTAIGMAVYGYRPVVEMQFDAFAYPAFEQVISHLAKMRNRTRGALGMPVVVRIPYGGGIGGVEHHSDSSEAHFAHTPGLHVLTPATVADAYSMLREAIDSPDPVIFFEPKRLYWSKEALDLPVSTGPIGTATVRRAGRDATLVVLRPDRAGLPGSGGAGRGGRHRARGARPAQPGPARRGRRSCAASGTPGGRSWCTRPPASPASAPNWPRGSRRSASTSSRPRWPGSPGSTSRTRRRSTSTGTCRTPTACSTRWTGRWRRSATAATAAAPDPLRRRGAAQPLAPACSFAPACSIRKSSQVRLPTLVPTRERLRPSR